MCEVSHEFVVMPCSNGSTRGTYVIRTVGVCHQEPIRGYQLYDQICRMTISEELELRIESEYTWPIDHILSHHMRAVWLPLARCMCRFFLIQHHNRSIEQKKRQHMEKLYMAKKKLNGSKKRRGGKRNMLNAWMMESIQKATRSRTVRSKAWGFSHIWQKKNSWNRRRDDDDARTERGWKKERQKQLLWAYWSLDAAEKPSLVGEKKMFAVCSSDIRLPGCTNSMSDVNSIETLSSIWTTWKFLEFDIYYARRMSKN